MEFLSRKSHGDRAESSLVCRFIVLVGLGGGLGPTIFVSLLESYEMLDIIIAQ